MDLAESAFLNTTLKTQEFVIQPYHFFPSFLHFTEIFELPWIFHVYFKCYRTHCEKTKNQRSQLFLTTSEQIRKTDHMKQNQIFQG